MVTATTRIRLEKQAYASNDEAWGDHLNEGVFDLVDEAVAGYVTVALVGNYTLDSQNYITDEARNATIKFTGTGPFTVTAPAVEKQYVIWNACTGDLTLKPSGGTGSIIRAGKKAVWFTDGTTGYTLDPTLDEIKAPAAAVSLNSQKITSLGTGTDTADGVNKGQMDTAILAAVNSAVVNVPVQTGNAGKYLKTDGTNPAWDQIDISTADVTGTLPIASGGTGATTAQNGRLALLPAVAANGLKVLRVNTGATDYELATLAASGMSLLSVTSISSAATVDITANINSTYDHYILVLTRVKPATDNVSLLFRTSTNAGSSFAASGYAYGIVRVDSDSAGTVSGDSSNSTDSVRLVTASAQMGNDTNEHGWSGIINLYAPSEAKYFQMDFKGSFYGSAGALCNVNGTGSQNTAADVDAVRFLMSSGNIASGTIRLYGLAKT